MIFERTADMDLVRRILTDPRVWPHVGDDFAPPAEDFRANNDPRIWYVLVIEGCEVTGLVTFLPKSTVMWDTHLVLTGRARKARGADVLKAAFRWMVAESGAEYFEAQIPKSNRLAWKLANRCMHFAGRHQKAFRKGGKLQDLLIFGVGKGELCPVS